MQELSRRFFDDYEDDYVCTKLLFDDAPHRTGEMKQWESKEIANIMNNAIEGWKQHGTHIVLERNMESSGHGNE